MGALMAALAWEWWPLIAICGLSLGLVCLVTITTYRDMAGSLGLREQPTSGSSEAATGQSLAERPQLENIDNFYRTYDNAILIETERIFREQAERYQPGPAREKFLIRSVSTVAVLALFEETWLTIFRSQIHLLEALNFAPRSMEDVRGFYDLAATINPTLYGQYSFDQWLIYMRSQSLTLQQDNIMYITIRGREFLKYLVETGRSAVQRFN